MMVISSLMLSSILFNPMDDGLDVETNGMGLEEEEQRAERRNGPPKRGRAKIRNRYSYSYVTTLYLSLDVTLYSATEHYFISPEFPLTFLLHLTFTALHKTGIKFDCLNINHAAFLDPAMSSFPAPGMLRDSYRKVTLFFEDFHNNRKSSKINGLRRNTSTAEFRAQGYG